MNVVDFVRVLTVRPTNRTESHTRAVTSFFQFQGIL